MIKYVRWNRFRLHIENIRLAFSSNQTLLHWRNLGKQICHGQGSFVCHFPSCFNKGILYFFLFSKLLHHLQHFLYILGTQRTWGWERNTSWCWSCWIFRKRKTSCRNRYLHWFSYTVDLASFVLHFFYENQ